MKRLFSSARPWSQRADLFLVGLAVLGLVLHGTAERTRKLHPQPHLLEKMAAATRTIRCYEAIRQHRMGRPGAIDRENDPEGSGLIGQEFSLTTTDRGILSAKLTSVNPNYAALFVEYFHECGLEPGDPVAIAMTGSFPALNIAVLAAAEEMSIKAIPITSIGASMWGANDPEFTWLDMEALLNDQGLLHTRSVAASMGGSNDRGRGLSPKGRNLLREAIERAGVPAIDEATLDDAIRRRVEIFDDNAEPRGIRAYVNIGGSSASIGTSMNGRLIRAGVNKTLPAYNWTQRGALHLLARRGIPVVHILRIETIAERHGFPIAPDVIPSVGEGEIYHQEMYDLRIVVPAFLTFAVLCFGVLRSRQRAAKLALESSPTAEPRPPVSPPDRGAGREETR
ncbi:MAG: poly-gamma-glutamate system protein [Candidatus Eisenbacteria bacterium]|nr:poly-gamma-glutamate system protein [Candidatus Eisenbacteria bacterium]